MTDDRHTGGEEEMPADVVPAVDVAGSALGALSSEEERDVQHAAASDEQVAAELAEMQSVVAELGSLVPRRQMNRGRSAGVRSRLVSRAAASREGRAAPAHPVLESVGKAPSAAATQSTPATPPYAVPTPAAGLVGGSVPQPRQRPLPQVPRRTFNWLALAAGIAFVVTAGALYKVTRDQARFRNAVAGQRVAMEQTMDTLKASMAAKDSMIASLTGPQMKAVDLVNYGSMSPLARMYWDQKTQQWTMYAYHLPQPAQGKTFQVWLITRVSAKPISAGVFMPSANGTAIMHAKYALDPGMLRQVAITEEPMGGMPYPTGPMIIAGSGRGK